MTAYTPPVETAKPKKTEWWQSRRIQILLVVLIALLLRSWAAWQLPSDADEPVYVGAGYRYVQAFEKSGLNGVINLKENLEHPPLVKLIYAAVIGLLGKSPAWSVALMGSRYVSVALGTLSVALVAGLDPLAGLLLAVHSMTVKYTSEAYLEALPQLASLLAIIFLLRSKRAGDGLFWLSAACLGLVAAGKYSYAPILVPLLVLYFFHKRYAWQMLLPYLTIAGLAFWALNPVLWSDPLNRLFGSLTFHAQYTHSSDVQRAGYPWYQPLRWLSKAYPAFWHPEVFFYYPIDGWLSLMAFVAIRWEWQKRPWLAAWLVTSLLFLLAWPTKWPQYTLVLTPAVCLLAATSLRKLIDWAREQESYWGFFRNILPRPSRLVSILAAVLLVVVVLGQVVITIANAYVQRGWWSLTINNTPLPANAVYAVLPYNGQMALGTANGLAFVSLSEVSQYPDQWTVWNTANSGLPGNLVQALALAPDGALWAGTSGGVGRYQNGSWTSFRRAELGLPSDSVQALALDQKGRLWVGTGAGVTVYDGQKWRPYPVAAGQDAFITALAVQPTPGGETVWAGSSSGLWLLDEAGGAWRAVERSATGLGLGGISRLLVDSQDRLWAASLGGGLARLDESGWTVFNITNSDLPYNTVVSISEPEAGIFWIGVTPPTEVGGILVRYDGKSWKQFLAGRSGFSGAEPSAAALDPAGHLWVATRSRGVDVYTNGK